MTSANYQRLQPPYPSEVKSIIDATAKVGDRVTSVHINRQTGQIILKYGSGKTYTPKDTPSIIQ